MNIGICAANEVGFELLNFILNIKKFKAFKIPYVITADLPYKDRIERVCSSNGINFKGELSVNSDEFIKEYKGEYPILRYDERAQSVSECKYVDEIIDPPDNSSITIDYMEKNSIDYIVHGKTDEKFLKKWYKEPIKEKRMVLFEETQGIRTQYIKDKNALINA